ncbi:unnamed protein product [Rhizophagus irregularis]|nr:unnamed protein product [Rhizophagus irregularis]
MGISYEQTIHARVDNGTRRTFNKHIKEHNPQNCRHHRLITSQRYRFLYTASQSINKPIKHLQYTHGWDLSKYKFRTPLSKYCLPQRSLVIEDISFMNLTLTVEPYNPIPDIPFPEKYNKIIPKNPIYNKHAQKRAKRLDDQAHNDAIYHGTSFNRISRRIAAKDVLTKITLQFDELMKVYIEYYFKNDKMKDKNRYHRKMVDCAYNSSGRREFYDYYIDKYSRVPTGALNDTSDDTIELKKRPKKHRSPYSIDHYFLANNSDRTKRLRVSPDFLNDSTGVGDIKLDEYIF